MIQQRQEDTNLHDNRYGLCLNLQVPHPQRYMTNLNTRTHGVKASMMPRSSTTLHHYILLLQWQQIQAVHSQWFLVEQIP